MASFRQGKFGSYPRDNEKNRQPPSVHEDHRPFQPFDQFIVFDFPIPRNEKHPNVINHQDVKNDHPDPVYVISSVHFNDIDVKGRGIVAFL